MTQPDPAAPLWLANSREFRPPVDKILPVWLRHGKVNAGPIVPGPEFHPCCECSVILSGRVLIRVGSESIERRPGDVFLVPPGLPHDQRVLAYPVRFATLFFEPFLLLELSPEHAGPLLLRRFLAKQPLARRLLQPTAALRPKIMTAFREMIREAKTAAFGWEVRIGALLLDLMVRLLRWEIERGEKWTGEVDHADWKIVCDTLHFLREHSAEEIYALVLARRAGISTSQLRKTFRDLLGITWGQYLNLLRLDHAMDLLSQDRHSVAEIALASGFQTLSHFNDRFFRHMGMSPSRYRKRISSGKTSAGTG